jgi:hypothetical protein
MREFDLLEKHFDCRFVFQGMVSVPIGVVSAMLRLPSKGPLSRMAFEIDKGVRTVPGLRTWCRHVFIEGRPKPA